MTKLHYILSGRVPSAKNNMQLIRVHGRTIPIKSKAYQAFHKDGLKQLAIQHQGAPYPARSITIAFQIKGKYDIDLDNAASSIFDLLADAGVIENDKDFLECHLKKSHQHEAWVTTIELT